MTALSDTHSARPTCQAAQARLGAYVRARLSSRAAHRVTAHLECCRACTAAYLELVDPGHAVRGWPRTPALGMAIASVLLGGLVITGLVSLGDDENGNLEDSAVAGRPFATASPTATDAPSADAVRHPKPAAASTRAPRPQPSPTATAAPQPDDAPTSAAPTHTEQPPAPVATHQEAQPQVGATSAVTVEAPGVTLTLPGAVSLTFDPLVETVPLNSLQRRV